MNWASIDIKYLKKKMLAISPPFHLTYWKWLRLVILWCLDIVLVGATYWASYYLRLDSFFPRGHTSTIYSTLPVVIIVHVFVFSFGGMYRQVWRYANFNSALMITKCTFIGSVLSLVGSYLVGPTPMPPRSIFIIYWILSTMIFAVTRFSWRTWKNFQATLSFSGKERCLIYGAGGGGDLLLRQIIITPTFPYHPIGFIDDDLHKNNRLLHGVKIVGSGAELTDLCRQYNVKAVVIAIPSAPGKVIRDIVANCQAAGVKPLIMPDLNDSLGDTIVHPRPIDIKDLLKRSPKSIDTAKITRFFHGKTVMVTGAGGSIGSEICRQILPCQPGRLILIDNSEFNLYAIEMELREKGIENTEIHAVLASVTDFASMEAVFKKFRPSFILHAAAYKHVPLLEHNPLQGIWNNISGTRNVCELAVSHGTERFLLISTDKAVKPVSVMGFTKRGCELVVQAMNTLHGKQCGFCAVRFGNVLGSSGSVIPRFIKQIEQGGPVTVTHPEITRFFMLTSEAVGLVLQSIVVSNGGEIFVLNMGEPVKIFDMAKQLILLTGKEPGKDIEIHFTGLRPGEKLYEELIIKNTEKHVLHDDVYVAHPQKIDPVDILQSIDGLLRQVMVKNEETCLTLLKRIVLENDNNLLKPSLRDNVAEIQASLH